MKLRALELEQFRKFDRPVRLSGFTDSLNLLCGPNEFGKSTILAAIRGLLFERHNSKAEPVKRMQPWRGNAAPRLAMEFEIDNGRWRIEKRFLHQPVACLTASDGSRFDGEAAEEQLQRLLGFRAAGKQGARLEQMGVWGALWVTQRESVQQADLSFDLARATITGCLDAEVGVLTGGEKGQALMRAAREQSSRLLDGNGRPKGRYREVGAAVREIDTRLSELRERARRMSDDADALRQRIAALAKASDPVAEQQEQDALLDARRRKEAALLYQKRLDATQAAYALAERNAEDAERQRTARTARTEAITASDAALANAIKVAGQSRISVEHAEAAVAACREAVSAAQACATNSRQRARHHRGMVEVVRRAATPAAQQAVLEQAASLQSRVNGLVARLEGMRIDKERIAAIRKAVRERDVTRLVLQAQATQIDFDLLPEVADRVSLGGIALTGGRKTLAVVEDAEIAIAGIGRFHVRPAIRDRQKLLKNAMAAEEHLEGVVAAAGTADPADAERQWSDRELLERDLCDARAELTRLVPGDPSSGLAPGISALRDHIDVLRRRIEEECSALGVTDLPAMADAIAEARIAEEAEITAGEALTAVRAELDIMSTRRTDAREALARAEA
jgi:hypothetical protein